MLAKQNNIGGAEGGLDARGEDAGAEDRPQAFEAGSDLPPPSRGRGANSDLEMQSLRRPPTPVGE